MQISQQTKTKQRHTKLHKRKQHNNRRKRRNKRSKEFIFKILNAELMDDTKKIRKELFKKKRQKARLNI